MAGTGKYSLYEAPNTTETKPGQSNQKLIKSLFKSPMTRDIGGNNPGIYNHQKIVQTGNEKLVPAIQDANPVLFAGGKVKLDFSDGPDLKTVKTGGGGLPSTPWTPNLGSPGEGNGANATAVEPMAIENPLNPVELSTTFQVGANGLVDPKATAAEIASNTKLNATQNNLVEGAHPGGPAPKTNQ